MRLARVVEFFYRQPWAILPELVSVGRQIVARRAENVRLTEEQLRIAIGRDPDAPRPPAAYLVTIEDGRPVAWKDYDDSVAPRRNPEAEATSTMGASPASSAIAVLNVFGVISQRMAMMDDLSGGGGASTEQIAKLFRRAVKDPAVKAIVLNVDSPGGGVYGVRELADEIFAARDQKPVVAVANSLMASAAYWLGASASEVSVTPGGEVGSIGVFSAHEDLSKALDVEGVKVTLISAGRFKTEANPYEPLSDEARAAIQASVDDYYDAFVKAVARGRGVAPSKVRSGYGQGRVLPADRARSEGMVDRVETLDEAVARMMKRYRLGGGAQAFDVAPGLNDRVDFVEPAAAAEAERPTTTASASGSLVKIDEPARSVITRILAEGPEEKVAAVITATEELMAATPNEAERAVTEELERLYAEADHLELENS